MPTHRRIGRKKGDLNSKLHAIYDQTVKSLQILLHTILPADYVAARPIFHVMPRATVFIACREP